MDASIPDILVIVAVLLCCGLGVLMTAIRLPGTWLIVLTGVGYGWWTGWQRTTVILIGVCVGIAVVAEVLELLLSALMARRAGASRRAAWGGLLGGILGMFLLTFLLPVPILGSMVGALAGCFLGAALMEMSVRKELAQGTKVGLFSAMGFVLGAVTKLALAMMMSGVLLTQAVCSPPDPASNVSPVESVAPDLPGDESLTENDA